MSVYTILTHTPDSFAEDKRSPSPSVSEYSMYIDSVIMAMVGHLIYLRDLKLLLKYTGHCDLRPLHLTFLSI